MKDTGSKTSTHLRLTRLGPDATEPPPALPQFAHVARYWDQEHGCFAARLLPGEYYVTPHAEAICTVLGSCVSACVHDARLNVGGMNHFMLPLDASPGQNSWGSAGSAPTRYGNVAMERLINDILKLGARRQDLEIKLVGGAHMLSQTGNDIGARNIDFVREYARAEGFRIVNEDLGDVYARRVIYFPQTGRLRVRKLTTGRDETLAAQERQYLEQLDARPVDGDIELF
jgi:chemotaxis protein CheD